MSLAGIPLIAFATYWMLNTGGDTPDAIRVDSHWKSLPEAVKAARTSGKKILIDVFTDWCTWCKRMDKDVYAASDVRQYLEAHFEIVKLDAESSTIHDFRDGRYSEKEIAAAFGVDGYPTTIFLSSDAETITTVPGYLPQKTFLAVLEYIHDEHYKKTNWQEFSKQKGVE